MNSIIYGPEKPKVNFRQSPDGSITFDFENNTLINLENRQDTLTWCDVFTNGAYSDCTSMFEGELDEYETFTRQINEFAEMTGSEAERKFLTLYVEECKTAKEFDLKSSLWNFPALIPQVWVNWLHYDSKNPKRAERAQNEPFRVDFMLKDAQISPNFIIFEIDGLSHFRDMETYTQHLRKDRWLRKQGWVVIRISNYEVENCSDFDSFFFELTGKYISLPF